MADKKFTTEMRAWLAGQLARNDLPRDQLYADFAKEFAKAGVTIGRNPLARIMYEGGGKAAFIKRYQPKKEKEGMPSTGKKTAKKKPLPVNAETKRMLKPGERPRVLTAKELKAHRDRIALAFCHWYDKRQQRETDFRSPMAYAAMVINAGRASPSDPIANAEMIQDLVGDRRDVAAFVSQMPDFPHMYANPREVAQEIMRATPAFIDF